MQSIVMKGSPVITTQQQQLLDADQVAHLVRVKRQTVLRWHRAGRMPPAVRISDRTLRWNSREINKWLRQQPQSTNQD